MDISVISHTIVLQSTTAVVLQMLNILMLYAVYILKLESYEGSLLFFLQNEHACWVFMLNQT